MTEITLKSNSFVEINSEEQMEVNGGIGPLAVFALGVVGCAVGACVDYGVKKVSGKSISEHAWDAIEKVF